jgi:CheY-like chemotaxis protein
MRPTRKRILIADCHEDVLIVLEKMFEDGGFDTTTVWTAKEALELVDLHAFDLVLINDYLPDAECEEVLRALRRRREQTPCIVMQPSVPEIVDFVRFEGLGAINVLCKRPYGQIVEHVNESLICDRKNIVVALNAN